MKRTRPARAIRQREAEIPSSPASPRWVSRLTWGVGVLVVAALAWLLFPAAGFKSAPTRNFEIVHTYPHDPKAYCQGLLFKDGFLYESTGNYGDSSLRKVELETGKVLQQHNLHDDFFGEGLVCWQDQLVQLTWKNHTAIYYDLASFQERQRYAYRGEGWGLTFDGRLLIMSDGTSTLRFIDPASFEVQRELIVRDGPRRIKNLNELEYVEGDVLANIWYEDRIARISLDDGQVREWINLARLWPVRERPDHAVLNGIAYDAQQKRLFVTGKDWPKLFEIRVTK
jgi:glutaminyl-peptide cyclotransferase